MPLLQLEHSLKECAKTEILVQECAKTLLVQECAKTEILVQECAKTEILVQECAKTEILVQECAKTEIPQELNAFNDLPTPVSRKYAYVDDLATMHADGDWQAVEGVLSKGGRLDHELNAKHEQKVNHNNEVLYFCSESNYLGVTLDRSLTYHRQLELLHRQLELLQEADITRRAHEAACWLRLGC